MPLDCSQGSILHIEDFEAEGFEPTDKFVFIVGASDRNTVLAFVITSQEWNKRLRAKEIVTLVQGSLGFLNKESYIQCFDLHKLNINDLQFGYSTGKVKNCGKCGSDVLHDILDVVADSDMLPQIDVQLVFQVLRNL